MTNVELIAELNLLTKSELFAELGMDPKKKINKEDLINLVIKKREDEKPKEEKPAKKKREVSAETRAKLSQSMKQAFQDPEKNQNLRDGIARRNAEKKATKQVA